MTNKTHDVELTECEMARLEYDKARKEYYAALERLNWVDPDMYEIANEEVTSALIKFNTAAKRMKMLSGNIAENIDNASLDVS